MTELEHDLRVATRKPILVANAPAQDEAVVVEPEVGCIHEQDFPDLNWLILESSNGEGHTVLSRGGSENLLEIEEALARREVVGPEDELATEVLNLVDGQAVGILTRFEHRYVSCPCCRRLGCGCYRHAATVEGACVSGYAFSASPYRPE